MTRVHDRHTHDALSTRTPLDADSARLYRQAFILALLTIILSILESVFAVYFGERDGSLTLFGFGIDSVIETISGVGIAHMILRIRMDPTSPRDRFETTALTITGVSFHLLAFGLAVTSVQKIVQGQQPETTMSGIIISIVSMAFMALLMRAKLKVGGALHSAPIIADAHCTRICIWMSVVLLLASAAYELTGFSYVDIIGSLSLAYLSFREGRESLEKAKHNTVCTCE
jgi:divalent metal cation (Fe/Co/Zn/Cd) transporter